MTEPTDSANVAPADGLSTAADPSGAAFAYTLSEPEGPQLAPGLAPTLAAWREMLIQQGLINLTSSFEMAHAYGSLSVRDPDSAIAFTMAPPGGTETFAERQLLRIQGYNLERSWVEATGLEPPSVDTLLHAALYAADSRIQWVFQCRSEALAEELDTLGIPIVGPRVDEDPEAPLPAWARTLRLLNENRSRPLVLAIPGRTASIFACGTTARDAGGLLLVYLARALEQRFQRLLPG
ncbi:MAG: hypothetical protein AAGG11_15715 [Pseudomonadota bacterium]